MKTPEKIELKGAKWQNWLRPEIVPIIAGTLALVAFGFVVGLSLDLLRPLNAQHTFYPISHGAFGFVPLLTLPFGRRP